MMIVGDGVATTVTAVATWMVLPELSVTVALMMYVRGAVYWCVTMAEPTMAPRSWLEPSPQSTCTLRTVLPLVAAAVTANVNDAGNPAPGGVVGGVITNVGADKIPTVTVPE